MHHWSLFGGTALFVIIECIGPNVGVYVAPFDAGVISFGISFAFIAYGLWRGRTITITRVTVNILNLPAAWQGKVIVLASDIHLGNVRGARFARKIVEATAKLKPETVIIAGDLYDGLRCDPAMLIASFKEFKSPQGTYFASGNHDYFGQAEEFFAAIRGVGIRILKNEIVQLNGLQLAGVDFEDAAHREDFEAVLNEMPLDAAKPSVLIKHVPDNLDLAEKKGFSLQLSGHTHHGQFWPLSHITKYLFKGYDYGLKRMGRMWVFTSSGVGAWGPPFRLGTKSEIVAITLLSTNSESAAN